MFDRSLMVRIHGPFGVPLALNMLTEHQAVQMQHCSVTCYYCQESVSFDIFRPLLGGAHAFALVHEHVNIPRYMNQLPGRIQLGFGSISLPTSFPSSLPRS